MAIVVAAFGVIFRLVQPSPPSPPPTPPRALSPTPFYLRPPLCRATETLSMGLPRPFDVNSIPSSGAPAHGIGGARNGIKVVFFVLVGVCFLCVSSPPKRRVGKSAIPGVFPCIENSCRRTPVRSFFTPHRTNRSRAMTYSELQIVYIDRQAGYWADDGILITKAFPSLSILAYFHLSPPPWYHITIHDSMCCLPLLLSPFSPASSTVSVPLHLNVVFAPGKKKKTEQFPAGRQEAELCPRERRRRGAKKAGQR